MAAFPSVEWFEEVRSIFNNDESLHVAGGGACNARTGVKVGERNFLVVFEGQECTEVCEIPDGDLVDTDFYLDMPPDDWQEMIQNIATHGSADLDHSLNTLDLDLEEGLAKSKTEDQYRADLFFRYNQTLQFFYDASARVDTEFASA